MVDPASCPRHLVAMGREPPPRAALANYPHRLWPFHVSDRPQQTSPVQHPDSHPRSRPQVGLRTLALEGQLSSPLAGLRMVRLGIRALNASETAQRRIARGQETPHISFGSPRFGLSSQPMPIHHSHHPGSRFSATCPVWQPRWRSDHVVTRETQRVRQAGLIENAVYRTRRGNSYETLQLPS